MGLIKIFSFFYFYLWFFLLIIALYINFQTAVSDFSLSQTISYNQNFRFNTNLNINALRINNLKYQKNNQYFTPKLCIKLKNWTHQSQNVFQNYSFDILLISFVTLNWCSNEKKPCQNVLSRF